MFRKAIILSLILALTVMGCSSQKDIPLEESSSPTTEISAENESTDKTENSSPAISKETLKYMEYFETIPTTMLYGNQQETGFSDNEMSAFAIALAISNSHIDGVEYDFEKGSKKEELDSITKKYFNSTVKNYNTQFTKVLDSGNVVSTGWSPSPWTLVLKEKTVNEDNSVTCVFYNVGGYYGEGDFTYEQYLEDIKNCNFDSYGSVTLREITFFEKTDDKGNFYIEFISLKDLGESSKPYTIYNEE